MVPSASAMGRPAPMAAAKPSLITKTKLAPASSPISATAFFSTSEASPGIPITIRSILSIDSPDPCSMAFTRSALAWAMLSITPIRNGLTAIISSGVLPNIAFASSPTASTYEGSSFFTATTEGILYNSNLSPDGFATTVLRVPRSMPKVFVKACFLSSSFSSGLPKRCNISILLQKFIEFYKE